MGTENGEKLAYAVGGKCPDDPKTEIFEAVASGNAVLLREILQEMDSSERASALETKMETRLVYDKFNIFKVTPLILAARNGNVDCVKVLLDYKADIEDQGGNDEDDLWGRFDYSMQYESYDSEYKYSCRGYTVTPLFVATIYGNLDVLSCLVESGADVNTHTNDNCTPLMTASAYHNNSVVALLSEHGADVDLRDNTGKTALHYAVDSHDDFCGDDVDCAYRNDSPLMIVSEYGNDSAVPLPSKHGANMDFQDNTGKTAFYHAVDSHDVLNCLIKNGADVSACTNDNRTPLMIASKSGDANAVTFLIENGANVELQDKDGKTALHHAIDTYKNNYYSYNILSCLIKNGADVNARTNDNCTPLMKASETSDINVVILLIEHGANVELQDKDGKTALHHAVDFDQGGDLCDVLRCLIKNGADVNAHTNDNCTPLMEASAKSDIDVVTLLIEHGANVELQDKDGKTALHYAVAFSNEVAFQFLLKHRANMDQQDKNGDTALHYTVKSFGVYYRDSMKFACKLLALGASQLCNNQGLTPLLLASNECDESVVEYLITRPECTKKQRIDALELLGASLATHRTYFYERDAKVGFKYMKLGMEERFADPSHPLLKQPMAPVEAYQNRKESQSLEELARIEGDGDGDVDAIIMEGLIIKERILGTNNKDLLVAIRNVATGFPLSKDEVHLRIGLSKYAMKIAKSCNESVISDLHNLVSVIDWKNVSLKQKDLLLELLEQIVLEYENQQELRKGLESKLDIRSKVSWARLFNCSLFVVRAIAKFEHCEEGKTSPVSVLLRKLCQINPRRCDGCTLLHWAVVKGHWTDALPCTDTLKLLFNAGFNVNAVNNNGDTPLHRAVTFQPSNDNIHLLTDMLEVLLDGGAHHDFVNNDGKTAMDLAETDEARQILSEKRKLELKCISARAVKKFGLPYLGVVPKILEKYVSMH